jgi:hypothetical protein
MDQRQLTNGMPRYWCTLIVIPSQPLLRREGSNRAFGSLPYHRCNIR